MLLSSRPGYRLCSGRDHRFFVIVSSSDLQLSRMMRQLLQIKISLFPELDFHGTSQVFDRIETASGDREALMHDFHVSTHYPLEALKQTKQIRKKNVFRFSVKI